MRRNDARRRKERRFRSDSNEPRESVFPPKEKNKLRSFELSLFSFRLVRNFMGGEGTPFQQVLDSDKNQLEEMPLKLVRL